MGNKYNESYRRPGSDQPQKAPVMGDQPVQPGQKHMLD
jgi:hypothetical protein